VKLANANVIVGDEDEAAVLILIVVVCAKPAEIVEKFALTG
jgi:hypothetical protein